MFSRILRCTFWEFNFKDLDENMISVFMFERGLDKIWYLFDSHNGIIKIQPSYVR